MKESGIKRDYWEQAGKKGRKTYVVYVCIFHTSSSEIYYKIINFRQKKY